MSHQLAKAAIIGFISCNIAFAETGSAPDWNAETLTGDWNGKRGAMLASGYDLQVNYKLDFLNNTSGEKGRIYGLDHLDLKLNIDFEKSITARAPLLLCISSATAATSPARTATVCRMAWTILKRLQTATPPNLVAGCAHGSIALASLHSAYIQII